MKNCDGTRGDNPEIIQLKSNFIPRGLVTLESIFYKEDKRKEKVEDTKSSNSMGYEKVNIGSEEIPTMVLIGKDLSSKRRIHEFFESLPRYFFLGL